MARPQIPGAVKRPVRCPCCKGERLAVNGEVSRRYSMPALPMRCEECSATWTSTSDSLLAKYKPELRERA